VGSTNEAHDRLVNHLFGSGLTLAAVLNLQGLDREVSNRVRDVIEQLDAAIGEIRQLAIAAVAIECEPSQRGLSGNRDLGPTGGERIGPACAVCARRTVAGMHDVHTGRRERRAP